jgi:hypothetical protein
MRTMRSSATRDQGYSLDEAAQFLDYDRKTIEYWLRMGHLRGDWDSRRSVWNISASALVEFLRESGEPVPYGSSYQAYPAATSTSWFAADVQGD